MRNGCLLGLLSLTLLILGGLFGAGYLVGKLDLGLAPRFDTASALAPEAFGRLRIDFDNWPVYEVAKQASGFPNPVLALIMPYEASFALVPGGKEAPCTILSVLSLRRFAGFIASQAAAAEKSQLLTNLEHCEQLNAGALAVSATLPVQLAAPGLNTDAPVDLAKQHDIEFVLDNRGGLASKALLQYLQTLPAETDQQKLLLDRKWTTQFLKLLQEVQVLQLMGDFLDSGGIEWFVRLDCAQEQHASAALYRFALLQNSLFLGGMEKGMKLDGGLRQTEAGLEGKFVLEGYEAYAEQLLEAYIS